LILSQGLFLKTLLLYNLRIDFDNSSSFFSAWKCLLFQSDILISLGQKYFWILTLLYIYMICSASLAQIYAQVQSYRLQQHRKFYVSYGSVKKTGASFLILLGIVVIHIFIMFWMNRSDLTRTFFDMKV